MSSKPFPRCCHIKAYPGEPRACSYRVHASLQNAKSESGRHKSWTRPTQPVECIVLEFAGVQQNVPGKPDLLLFTHIGEHSCKSTSAHTEVSIGWNPPALSL